MRHNESLMRWTTEAAERYHKYVEGAQFYLESRKLWDGGVADTYCLGVVTDPRPEHRHFEGRLSIPYLTPSGAVNIKFRCIEHENCSAEGGKEHKKYMGTTGAEDRLYNVQALHEAEDILYVAEGEIDAISASVVGFPAVGISGASKWQEHYAKLFEDFAEVVVLADGDKAGEDFAARVLRETENARVVYMPDNEDVNSVIVKHGDDHLRRIIVAGTMRNEG